MEGLITQRRDRYDMASYGTFKKTVNENPANMETGTVLEYRSDDGWRVSVIMTFNDKVPSDSGGLRRMREYQVGIDSPSGERVPEELRRVDPQPHGTKAAAADEAKNLVTSLVAMGHGDY